MRITISLFILLMFITPPLWAEMIGSLGHIKGEVLLAEGKEESFFVQQSRLLNAPVTVKTAIDGEAAIALLNGSRLFLAPETHFELTSSHQGNLLWGSSVLVATNEPFTLSLRSGQVRISQATVLIRQYAGETKVQSITGTPFWETRGSRTPIRPGEELTLAANGEGQVTSLVSMLQPMLPESPLFLPKTGPLQLNLITYWLAEQVPSRFQLLPITGNLQVAGKVRAEGEKLILPLRFISPGKAKALLWTAEQGGAASMLSLDVFDSNSYKTLRIQTNRGTLSIRLTAKSAPL